MQSRLLSTLALATVVWVPPAAARDAASATASVQGTPEELTEEERRERDARKACKIAICAAFHNRKADGGDIACNVVKSWRREQVGRLVANAKVSWPWGRVKCVADIRLRREALIKAMTQQRYEAALDKHQVTCEVEREADRSAEIRFEFAPKVTFEKGEATKATLNWGKIEAPALVKGAMWTATATDNALNLLQSTVVDDINDFIGNKCTEVKEDWGGK